MHALLIHSLFQVAECTSQGFRRGIGGYVRHIYVIIQFNLLKSSMAQRDAPGSTKKGAGAAPFFVSDEETGFVMALTSSSPSRRQPRVSSSYPRPPPWRRSP